MSTSSVFVLPVPVRYLRLMAGPLLLVVLLGALTVHLGVTPPQPSSAAPQPVPPVHPRHCCVAPQPAARAEFCPVVRDLPPGWTVQYSRYDARTLIAHVLDERRRVRRTIYVDGRHSEYDYNVHHCWREYLHGRLTRVGDSSGTWTFKWSATGQLVEAIESYQHVIRLVYGLDGHLTAITDWTGRRWASNLEAIRDRLLRCPQGQTNATDAHGCSVWLERPRGDRTRYDGLEGRQPPRYDRVLTYDEAGRLMRIKDWEDTFTIGWSGGEPHVTTEPVDVRTRNRIATINRDLKPGGWDRDLIRDPLKL